MARSLATRTKDKLHADQPNQNDEARPEARRQTGRQARWHEAAPRLTRNPVRADRGSGTSDPIAGALRAGEAVPEAAAAGLSIRKAPYHGRGCNPP